MNRTLPGLLCLATLAVTAGCGEAPPDGAAPSASSEKTWNLRLQEFDLSGLAEPAAGRLQLVALPQAALQPITEDANGNALTATLGTAQVYGANVLFASGGVGYPAGCNTLKPQVMYSNVQVLSGCNEQLRNVYAKLTATSSGQTFCTKDTPRSAFTNALGGYVGLYAYEPLNPGTGTNAAISRTKQWALNLPDNGAFWFTGSLMAEVYPLPPTITTAPAEGNKLHTATSPLSVSFAWTNDLTADGGNPEPLTVAKPTYRNTQVYIYSCGSAANPFVASNCLTTVYGPSNTSTTTLTRSLAAGQWYQLRLRSRFRYAPSTTTYSGSFVSTRNFAVVTP